MSFNLKDRVKVINGTCAGTTGTICDIHPDTNKYAIDTGKMVVDPADENKIEVKERLGFFDAAELEKI